MRTMENRMENKDSALSLWQCANNVRHVTMWPPVYVAALILQP